MSRYNVAVEIAICSPADVDGTCVNSASVRDGVERVDKCMIVATDNVELGMMLARRLSAAMQAFIKEHNDELLQGWFTVKNVFEEKPAADRGGT